MDSFLYSINATVPIFLVMIVGWVIKQIGVIDDHFANVANKYVLLKGGTSSTVIQGFSSSRF